MMEGFEDCNGLETFCETGSYNSTIHCNGMYDCYNRNDEDPRFCIATKQNNRTLEKIEEINIAYDR